MKHQKFLALSTAVVMTVNTAGITSSASGSIQQNEVLMQEQLKR